MRQRGQFILATTEGSQKWPGAAPSLRSSLSVRRRKGRVGVVETKMSVLERKKVLRSKRDEPIACTRKYLIAASCSKFR